MGGWARISCERRANGGCLQCWRRAESQANRALWIRRKASASVTRAAAPCNGGGQNLLRTVLWSEFPANRENHRITLITVASSSVLHCDPASHISVLLSLFREPRSPQTLNFRPVQFLGFGSGPGFIHIAASSDPAKTLGREPTVYVIRQPMAINSRRR